MHLSTTFWAMTLPLIIHAFFCIGSKVPATQSCPSLCASRARRVEIQAWKGISGTPLQSSLKVWILPPHIRSPLNGSLWTTSLSMVVFGKCTPSCAVRHKSRNTTSLSLTVMTPDEGTASHFSLFSVLSCRNFLAALQVHATVQTSRLRLLKHFSSNNLWTAATAGGFLTLNSAFWTLAGSCALC